MALLGGIACAATGAEAAFEYNRENFLEDREQRLKKEFVLRKFRVVQANLWRQDIRDYVSLTERKMSLYLIVTMLLLAFNISLWAEGQFPKGTPHWLTMGKEIANASAFAFMLLTVWLSLNAAVAAQSFQTRILTQLVRLPLPSWTELEACRSYASDFEKLEPRQMFRLPFLMGAMGRRGEAGGAAGLAADPWGLEREGSSIEELGCPHEVVMLRHIKLIRQAAVHWQTHEAFARASMTLGVNQLLVAMAYYTLGYAVFQTSAPLAALATMLVFGGTMEVLLLIDVKLTVAERLSVRVWCVVGQLASFIAAYNFLRYGEDVSQTVCAAFMCLAFLCQTGLVTSLTLLARVGESSEGTGALIPFAFEEVLFLDAFSGVLPQPAAAAAAKESPARFPSRVYESRVAVPNRPEDFVEPETYQDMRHVQGAPAPDDTVDASKPVEKEFWTAASFVPLEARERMRLDDLLQALGVNASKDHDHTSRDGEEPGILPWRTFQSIAITTCLAWTCAGATCAVGAYAAFGAGPPELKTSLAEQVWRGTSPELVAISWPYADFSPKSFTCDADGRQFLVSDGVSWYSSELAAVNSGMLRDGTPSLQLQLRAVSTCASLRGQHIQDIALLCPPRNAASQLKCQVLALHGHSLSICGLSEGETSEPDEEATMSDAWLDARKGEEKPEEALWLLPDLLCARSPGALLRDCVAVGSSRGRVATLRSNAGRKLVAADVTEASRGESQSPDSMRSLTARHVGLLYSSHVEVQDEHGGLAGRWLLPSEVKDISSFCVGNDSAYFLSGQGLWRVKLPEF